MVARSLRLLTGLRAVRPGMLVLLVVLQLLLAALVPVSAWATGLVVAQANAEPVPATAFALVVFVLALWLGSRSGTPFGHRAHVARAVDGAVRSEVRLLLSSATTLDLVEVPEVRDDIAHVMSTGGARGYEQSIGTASWAQLGRWFDVVAILAAAAVLVPLSPVFAGVTVSLMLLTRWVLQRTWQREAATEADGARGERRTAYWTGLGTGDAVAKEVRIFGMGRWVTKRRRAEAEAYLVPRWQRHGILLRGQLLPAALAVAGGCLVIGVPAWAAATARSPQRTWHASWWPGWVCYPWWAVASWAGTSHSGTSCWLPWNGSEAGSERVRRTRTTGPPKAGRSCSTRSSSLRRRTGGLEGLSLRIAPGEVVAVVVRTAPGRPPW